MPRVLALGMFSMVYDLFLNHNIYQFFLLMEFYCQNNAPDAR